jgi:two-component system phosphate regulon sensor histidine kinase PhoR
LDNAIKHTPSGGFVTVRGRVGDGWVAVEVSDTGKGISSQHLPRIFDRFYRVDKSRSRELGGVGLGLSISKALVESHDGQIEVESTLGKGSTFRVILPVCETDGKDGGVS